MANNELRANLVIALDKSSISRAQRGIQGVTQDVDALNDELKQTDGVADNASDS